MTFKELLDAIGRYHASMKVCDALNVYNIGKADNLRILVRVSNSNGQTTVRSMQRNLADQIDSANHFDFDVFASRMGKEPELVTPDMLKSFIMGDEPFSDIKDHLWFPGNVEDILGVKAELVHVTKSSLYYCTFNGTNSNTWCIPRFGQTRFLERGQFFFSQYDLKEHAKRHLNRQLDSIQKFEDKGTYS